MGQDSYALLKVPWKSVPTSIQQALTYDEDDFRPFLVGNVVLPACLVWTPINYHDLDNDDEPDVLRQLLIDCLPLELLSANVEPRGVLLFADGGEPKRSRPCKTTYHQLERHCSTFGRWVKVRPEDLLPDEGSSEVDKLLLSLSESDMVAFLRAKIQRDFKQAKQILIAKLGRERYSKVESNVKKWFEKR